MSQFEEGLRQARRRQIRFYIAGLIALVLVGFVVVGVLASTNGTAIKILPAEAVQDGDVLLVDGFGLAIGTTVYTMSEGPVVAVRADGFREKIHAIQPGDLGRTIEIELEPLPGRLLATTEQGLPDTSWSINDESATTGSSFETERDAGTYKLVVNHPHFNVVVQDVELERGQTVELSIPLEPVAGRVNIDSDPSGAAVLLDGQSLGITPLDMPMAGGRYDLRVVAPERTPVEETISLTNAEPELVRRYILKPLSAMLKIRTVPGGGQLLVDGRRVPPSGEIEVPANEDVTVTYVREGYRARSETLRLTADETRELTLRLQEDLGFVDIRTTPDADILVDGKNVGKGSVELQLQAVPHTIELRKRGYRTVRKTITPSSSRRLVIREDLVGETAARLAESPRSYTNSVGMTLRLFEPGIFTMGAPRSQKGQRANEFEKRVRLTKPFYAARHEVTNEQFAMFSGNRSGRGNAPVTGVSWREAAEFANWLSEREQLLPFYRFSNGRVSGWNRVSDGYRLLSEAEWEWLARKAGRESEVLFTWGNSDTVPKQAGNIADESANGLVRFYVPRYSDGFPKLAPVGSFPAEPSGLFDMTGNVSEWVHDQYSLIPPSRGELLVDPLGDPGGSSHVIKGSSWKSGTRTQLRASYREGASSGSDDVGFRLGRYLHGAP